MSTNENFDAMRAMARNVTVLLAAATETCAEAGGVDHAEEQNLLVGTLMPVREQLAAALAQLDTIMTLHRLAPPLRRGGGR
jgi:hypothetical protein